MTLAEFIDTYNAMVALIQSRLAERGGEERAFESPEIVAASFVGLSRGLLLGLPSDEQFVAAAYYKILDREVEADELVAQLKRLASSAATRDTIIDELDAGDEAAERSIRIQWV